MFNFNIHMYFNILYLMIFIKIILYCLLFTILVAIITVYERKLLASIQQRIGPFEVGFKGRIQFFADSIKLLSKGILFLINWLKMEIMYLSIISIFLVFLFWPNYYSDINCLLVDIEYNILYTIILSCVFAYSVINIGVISKNKYALIASLRYVLIILNGELLFGFLWVFIIMCFESVSFNNVKIIITNNNKLFISFIPILIIIIVCFCIETGRNPFDLGESESELVSGYITEISGFIFTLYYLGEYFHLLMMSNYYSVILCNIM